LNLPPRSYTSVVFRRAADPYPKEKALAAKDHDPGGVDAPGAGVASRDLLRRLTLAPGAPGAEDAVRRIVRDAIRDVGPISHDRLGSILCEKKGESASPRVVLDAHLDEVAFLVQSITDEGKLGFVPLGGWWGHVLLAQRVDVLTGGGKVVPGVVGSKPPHFLKPQEREKVIEPDAMYIDVGAATRKDAESLGIRVGDPAVPHAEFIELAAPDILSSKAFDNRVGVGLLCEVLLGLCERRHPNTVIGVGAVQEEIGCRGAETSSEMARPDVAIVLEGTPADDLPGFPDRQAILGKGPQIRFFDPTAVSNRRLVSWIQGIAAQLGIPIQSAVRRTGGTDARSIHVHGRGVPTVVIGVPARYIHTHVSLIHWQDYLAARKLVLEAATRLDAATAEGFTRFDS
jgi:putative aminopeptidase FrvX